MELGLKNKVAVVTGSGQGIGLAVARGLAREGVHLVLCARNGKQVARNAAMLRRTCRVKAVGFPVDVTRPEEIDRLVAEVKRTFGGADILINNAGTGTEETVLTAPDEKWQYFWDLHVMAAVRLARGLIPLMHRRGGGVILDNASICAKQPMGHEPIYNVTKAALMMFSKCLSLEAIKYNVRVNCVNPGMIQTMAWENAARKITKGTPVSWRKWLKDYAKRHAPIGRFATPEELADFMVFLCSDRASYCVGSAYYVDGGWLNVVA